MGNLRKRCGKCGWTGLVRPRERRCKRVRIPGGYACWGRLERVARPARRVRGACADRPQDRAAKELARVHRRIAEVARQVVQRSKVLAGLVTRANRLERLAAMTDAERAMLSAALSAQAREAAQARRARGRTRGIKLEGEV